MEFRVILVVFLSLFLPFSAARFSTLSPPPVSSQPAALLSRHHPLFLHLRRRVPPRCSTTQITLSPYRWLGHATTWTKGHGRTWIFTVSRTGIPPPCFHRRRRRSRAQPASFQREAIRERDLAPRLSVAAIISQNGHDAAKNPAISGSIDRWMS